MVPTGLEKWEVIFQSGKNQGILLKILGKSEKITLENRKKNTGKVREICHSEKVGTIPFTARLAIVSISPHIGKVKSKKLEVSPYM